MKWSKLQNYCKIVIIQLKNRLYRPIKAEIVELAPNVLLLNRTALITGGSKGIGFAIAKLFVNSGAFVIITGRSKSELEKKVLELGGQSCAMGVVMDNSCISEMQSKFDLIIHELMQRNRSLDILVNNAGCLGGNISEASENDYDRVLDTNLKGTFFLCQLVSKYMINNGIKGNILNIASSSSLRPAVSAYTISKWGIRGLTMGLARALAKYGITVNAIAPGQTLTPMMKKSDDNLANPTSLLGRWIMPEEIANGALFLVSGLGRAIMGDIIYMTGGSGLLSFEDMNYDIFD